MPYLSIDDASRILGRSRSSLRDDARRGKIRTEPKPGHPNGRLYWVDLDTREAVTARRTDHPPPAAQDDGLDALAALLEQEATPGPAPAASADRVWRVASIWDVHVPEHDPKAFAAWLAWAKVERPDELIIGGDFLELEACSEHGGVPRPRALVDEIKAGRAVLAQIREALPDARMVYLEGNHETRLSRITVNRIPTLEGALTVPALLQLEGLRIGWRPYGELYRPKHPSGADSRMHYVHGRWTNKFHAHKHADFFGSCVRYGHVHTAQLHLRGRAGGHVHGAWATPCLRTLDPAWMAGATDWVQGFGLDEIHPDGRFTAHTICMVGGRFAWGGRMYETA